MMITGALKLFVFCIMVVALAQGAIARADVKPVNFPTTIQVANRLGSTLAVDPRVLYPPDHIQCWFPDTDTFTMQCDAYRQAHSSKWDSSWDVLYGVKVKVFEDSSWTITNYRPIARWGQSHRRHRH